MPTLLWRSALATPVLVLTAALAGGAYPSGEAFWAVVASGLAGVGVGDVLAYTAFVELGPRRAVQLMALAPLWAFLLAWGFLGEAVAPVRIAGAALVLSASALAVWIERRTHVGSTEPGRVTARGVASAIGAAFLLGVGATLTRLGYRADPTMHPFVVATLRVGSATALLWLVPFVRGGYGPVFRSLADRPGMLRVAIGTLFGPYLGMLTFVGGLKYIEAGLATTLVSLSPLFIIPISAVRHRARIGLPAVAAALLAVAGVALISLH